MSISMSISINGRKEIFTFDNPNQIISEAILLMPGLKYWSYEALRDMYIGIIEMVADFCFNPKEDLRNQLSGNDKAKISRFIKTVRSRVISHHIPKNKEALMCIIYDNILVGEGLSTLRGFGITNQFGDNLKGNPEIHSIRLK